MTETAQAAIPQFFRVAQEDDVAVALTPLESGQSVEIDGQAITLRDAIPRGHKFALHPIAAGERVHRYRAPIGLATAPIAAGEHVHSHNLRTGLSGEVTYTANDHPAGSPCRCPCGGAQIRRLYAPRWPRGHPQRDLDSPHRRLRRPPG
jgi:altronate hydrolase